MWTTEVTQPVPSDTARQRFLQRNASYMARYIERAERLKTAIQGFADTGQVSTEGISKISLKLLSACNLRCSMCFQWREDGIDHASATGFHRNLKKTRLEFDECHHLFEFLRQHPCEVVLTGGEPMLHPQFSRFVQTLAELGCPMVICTNGTLLDKHFDTLSRYHDRLAFLISIDGPRAVHDAIRGDGYHAVTTDAIRRLAQAKRDGLDWIVGVESTLLASNMLHSEAIIEECEALGVDWMVFNHLWIANAPARKQFNQFCAEHGEQAHSADGYDLGQFDDNYLNMVKGAIARIKAHPSTIPVLISPNLAPQQLQDYYQGRYQPENPYYKMGVKLDIDIDGRVVMTKQFPEIAFGNITEQPIEDIIGSPLYARTARRLLNEPLGILAACPDMHNLRIDRAC
ncbi:radical SAM protein [Pseudomonas sp. zfem004]|uniref:radical SAM protein n=1 Tax=unclassified Pseudomonas TaxID=196821 RepID=UPI00129B502C|nr:MULTISPECIES: radical SAM protein [unclassified Pseudomonas]MDU9401728.1 radical SAM protein [Pseudomonas sp. zfem004]